MVRGVRLRPRARLLRSGAPPCLRSRKDQGNPGCSGYGLETGRLAGRWRPGGSSPREVMPSVVPVGCFRTSLSGKGRILTSA